VATARRPLRSPRKGPGAAVLAIALAAAGALAAPGRAARADEAGAAVLEDLKRGLKEERGEARASAIRETGRRAGLLSPEERRKAALLLRKALETDPDGGARVAVVATLPRLRDEAAWVPVILASRKDRDPQVNAAARRAVLTARPDLLPVVEKLLREDGDPSFRADLLLLLGARRRLDAVPICLQALADPHVRVATAAAEALEGLSGEALGYDARAWAAWDAARRAREAASPAPATGETVTRAPEEPPEPPPLPPVRGLVPDFYGLPLDAKDLVFLVDVSGSIGEAGFTTAKGELARAVERLPSDVRLCVLFFDETVRFWHPEMVPATPGVKAELSLFVRGIPRGRRTDVMTPLNAGLEAVRRRVDAKKAAREAFATPVTMVVVSDGQENKRETPGEFVGDKLERLDVAHAVVHAVVLGGKDNALMAALARRGGGRYLVVP
jgi:hypothetical protein